jgi:hypothetical protein
VESRSKGPGEPAVANVGIRVLRVTPRAGIEESARGLRLSDVITFTVTNRSERLRYLTLFGIQPGGAIRRYYPGYRGHRSIELGHSLIDEPLGDGIVLSVYHQPGPLRIVALFSADPLELEQVERAVDLLSSALADLSPVLGNRPDVLEHSVLVEIEARTGP